jgi:hypothetical protein
MAKSAGLRPDIYLKKLLLFCLFSCSLTLGFALPEVVASGDFKVVGNITTPVILYTPPAAGRYRVTIYAEDTTRLQSKFIDVCPAISFTSPQGVTIVGTPFGNQYNSWAGSDTEIVNSVAMEVISLSVSLGNPPGLPPPFPPTDPIEYFWIVEKM